MSNLISFFVAPFTSTDPNFTVLSMTQTSRPPRAAASPARPPSGAPSPSSAPSPPCQAPPARPGSASRSTSLSARTMAASPPASGISSAGRTGVSSSERRGWSWEIFRSWGWRLRGVTWRRYDEGGLRGGGSGKLYIMPYVQFTYVMIEMMEV